VKEAPRKEVVPVTPEFLAALLRKAGEQDREFEQAALNKALDRDRERTEREVAARVDQATYMLKGRAETAEGKLKAIYDACGLEGPEVSRLFGDGDFSKAVALVHRLGVASTYRGLSEVTRTMRPMMAALEGAFPPDARDQAA
jgi:hypothetical protein